MPFSNNNFGNGNPNMNNGEPRKKQNFPIGRIWTNDAQLDVSMWCPETGGSQCILMIKQALGKNPSTGRPSYEQNNPTSIPRFFMRASDTRLLVDVLAEADPKTMNAKYTKPNGDWISFVGTGNDIQIKIFDTKLNQDRTCTINGLSVNGNIYYPDFENLKRYIDMAYKKIITDKLDDDAFSKVVSAGSEEASSESPF